MAPWTLIFDLDGTLVDTIQDLGAALNGMLAERGTAPLSSDEVRGMVGDGARVLVDRALAARGIVDGLETALARFLALYAAAPAVDSAVYPGVVETLEALMEAGHRLGICTNKPEAPSLDLLDALGLRRFFGSVVGGDTLPVRKPDPEPVREARRRLGGGRAVMIGDSDNDLLAGRAAGIPVVLVSYGYARAPVGTLGADRVIDHFGDLFSALDGIFSSGDLG